MSESTPQGRRAQVEAAFAALNARDFEALGELPVHPKAEFHSVFATAEGEVYRGLPGLREWAEAVDAVFDRFKTDLIDFRELDDARAVVTVRATGRAKTSGLPVDARLTQIWTWRDGKMWRNEVFTDEREAYRAAGLSN
jgi:ketosteroid isomerase-like protein